MKNLDALVNFLRNEFYGNYEIVVLYGSILNEDQVSNDIDIMIVYKKLDQNDVKQALERVQRKTELMVHPLLVSVDDYGKNPCYKRITNKGIVVG